MERVSISEAAALMGVSKQTVRILMLTKSIDIGFVTGRGRKTYVIFRPKLMDLIGRRGNGEEM